MISAKGATSALAWRQRPRNSIGAYGQALKARFSSRGSVLNAGHNAHEKSTPRAFGAARSISCIKFTPKVNRAFSAGVFGFPLILGRWPTFAIANPSCGGLSRECRAFGVKHIALICSRAWSGRDHRSRLQRQRRKTFAWRMDEMYLAAHEI
jgi:hypothetical protein